MVCPGVFALLACRIVKRMDPVVQTELGGLEAGFSPRDPVSVCTKWTEDWVQDWTEGGGGGRIFTLQSKRLVAVCVD